MQHDPLNDALVSIKNAELSGKMKCTIYPASKLTGRVLNIMQKYGYISQFEFVENGRGGEFIVKLNGRLNSCGVVKPRFSVKKDEIEKFERRYLPGKNFGILVISSTKGVISNTEAKDMGIGGKLLAYVY
jgi:small subunit ribosomal protein S8